MFVGCEKKKINKRAVNQTALRLTLSHSEAAQLKTSPLAATMFDIHVTAGLFLAYNHMNKNAARIHNAHPTCNSSFSQSSPKSATNRNQETGRDSVEARDSVFSKKKKGI